MPKYKLVAKVTISIQTDVEASTLDEALEVAKDREKAHIPVDSFYSIDECWIAEGEIDGEPFDITLEKEEP